LETLFDCFSLHNPHVGHGSKDSTPLRTVIHKFLS
jgi:hypothetical protein